MTSMMRMMRVIRVCRRKWITKFTPDGPPWAAGSEQTLPPREYKNDVLCDIYEVCRGIFFCCALSYDGLPRVVRCHVCLV